MSTQMHRLQLRAGLLHAGR